MGQPSQPIYSRQPPRFSYENPPLDESVFEVRFEPVEPNIVIPGIENSLRATRGEAVKLAEPETQELVPLVLTRPTWGETVGSGYFEPAEDETPLIRQRTVERVVARFDGEICAIDGALVHALLLDDKDQYTAIFKRTDFDLGSPIEVGRTFVAQRVEGADSQRRWRCVLDALTPLSMAEVQELSQHYAQKFDGTGL